MKAIIPTAGLGKRLQPFTHSVPKVLLQVADRPILGHIIEKLRKEGVVDITFVVGYLGEQISEYVQREYPELNARFVNQEEALGLGHAIHVTTDLHQDSEEPVLIILGDTVIEADLSPVHDADANLIGVKRVDDPSRFGVVELEGDRIVNMIEKPEEAVSDLAIVGLYYIRDPRMLFDCLRENVDRKVRTKGEIQLTDALQLMLERGAVMKPLPVEGWYDCGKPETLLSTNEALLERYHRESPQEAETRFPEIRVKPPVFIDPSADVRNSIIGPHVLIGARARVHDSIVVNSIINEGADVQIARLTDSIIGNYARVKENMLRLYVGDNSGVFFDG